jgi:hypothetical protein
MTHGGDDGHVGDGNECERFHKEPGMHIRRARTCTPRRPAGTFEVRDSTGAVGCLPVAEGAKPSDLQQLKWQLLVNRLLEPVAFGFRDGCLAGNDTLIRLDRAFDAVFQCAPEVAVWLDPYVRELEHGRREWFAAECRGSEPGPAESLKIARKILHKTRATVDQYGCRLPRWLSVELTALFLQKVSFARGGGPQRSLSVKRMREVLSERGKLVRYLRSDRTRARVFSVELAELVELERLSKVA